MNKYNVNIESNKKVYTVQIEAKNIQEVLEKTQYLVENGYDGFTINKIENSKEDRTIEK